MVHALGYIDVGRRNALVKGGTTCRSQSGDRQIRREVRAPLRHSKAGLYGVLERQ